MALALTRLSWRAPQWWVAALVPVAWTGAAVPWLGPSTSAGPTHAGHLHQPMLGGAPTVDGVQVGLCLVAMMVPLTLPTLRRVALASLWPRRHLAMALCLSGYLAPWAVAALLLAAATDAVEQRLGFPASVAVSLGLALAWQRTRSKRRALRACLRITPLAPTGWRADWDCIHLGARVGWSCVRNCWALMTIAGALHHHPLALVAISALLVRERFGSGIAANLMRGVITELGFAFDRTSVGAEAAG